MGDRPRPRRRTTPSGRRSPLAYAVAAVCSLVLVAGVIVAWQRPGFAQVPPEPVDGAVWVLKNDGPYVGRINTGIGELDSATALPAPSTVVQDPAGNPADPVFVLDPDKHELRVLDTATVTFGARVGLPDSPEIAVRSGTVAVADRSDGRLWVGSSTDLSTVDADVASPVATVGGAGVVLAVSTAGTVFATRPGSGQIVRVDPGSDPVTTDLGGGPLSLGNPGTGTPVSGRSGDIQLTTVGDLAVVLDRADSALRVNNRRIPLPEMPDAVLQESGPAAGEVLVASSAGLLAVRLSDGAVRTVASGSGSPVTPVVVGGCRYAAWADRTTRPTITGLAVCGAEPAEPVTLTGLGPGPGSELSLRVRGDAVVLSDAGNGRSWIASDGFRPVDNWSDVTPDGPAKSTVIDEKQTSSDDLPRLPPDCTAVALGAPRVVDDEFGVRAGRTTVLRVLDNDPGVDCTSVVIDSVTPLPADVGAVAVVGNGSALQITVNDTVSAVPSARNTRSAMVRARRPRRGSRSRWCPRTSPSPRNGCAGRRCPPRWTARCPTTCWTTWCPRRVTTCTWCRPRRTARTWSPSVPTGPSRTATPAPASAPTSRSTSSCPTVSNRRAAP